MALVYAGVAYSPNYLSHHGILGQKWGIRRFQNTDGSLTAEGRERYGYGQPKDLKKVYGQALRKYNATKALDAVGYATPVITGAAGAAAGLLTLGKYGLPSAGATLGTYAGALAGTPALLLVEKGNKKREKILKETNPVKLNELRISEGTEFKRTSLKEKEVENERLYMALSRSKMDINYYTKAWPEILRKIAGSDSKVYQNTYKVAGEIIAPSYEKRKQVADGIIQADRKLKIELGKAYALDQLRLLTGSYGAKTLKDIEKIMPNAKEASDQYVKNIINDKKYSLVDDANFRTFTASIPTSGKLMDAYVNALKKEGYTAVFDDNGNSLAPFIVFDSSMIQQIGSRELPAASTPSTTFVPIMDLKHPKK